MSGFSCIDMGLHEKKEGLNETGWYLLFAKSGSGRPCSCHSTQRRSIGSNCSEFFGAGHEGHLRPERAMHMLIQFNIRESGQVYYSQSYKSMV